MVVYVFGILIVFYNIDIFIDTEQKEHFLTVRITRSYTLLHRKTKYFLANKECLGIRLEQQWNCLEN